MPNYINFSLIICYYQKLLTCIMFKIIQLLTSETWLIVSNSIEISWSRFKLTSDASVSNYNSFQTEHVCCIYYILYSLCITLVLYTSRISFLEQLLAANTTSAKFTSWNNLHYQKPKRFWCVYLQIFPNMVHHSLTQLPSGDFNLARVHFHLQIRRLQVFQLSDQVHDHVVSFGRPRFQDVGVHAFPGHQSGHPTAQALVSGQGHSHLLGEFAKTRFN